MVYTLMLIYKNLKAGQAQPNRPRGPEGIEVKVDPPWYFEKLMHK